MGYREENRVTPQQIELFNGLFGHRVNRKGYIHSPILDDGKKAFITRKDFLSERLIKSHLNGECIVGSTCAENPKNGDRFTDFIVLDIDKDTEAQHRFALQVEDAYFNGQNPTLPFVNPTNGHLHLIYFFSTSVPIEHIKTMHSLIREDAKTWNETHSPHDQVKPIEVYPQNAHAVRLPFSKQYELVHTITHTTPYQFVAYGNKGKQIETAYKWVEETPRIDTKRLVAILKDVKKQREIIYDGIIAEHGKTPTVKRNNNAMKLWQNEVQVLLEKGLWREGQRNEAVGRLVRLCVQDRQSEEQTIDYIMKWLDKAHNGLSKDYTNGRFRQIENEIKAFYRKSKREAKGFKPTRSEPTPVPLSVCRYLYRQVEEIAERRPELKLWNYGRIRTLWRLMIELYKLSQYHGGKDKLRISRNLRRKWGFHEKKHTSENKKGKVYARFNPVQLLKDEGLLIPCYNEVKANSFTGECMLWYVPFIKSVLTNVKSLPVGGKRIYINKEKERETIKSIKSREGMDINEAKPTQKGYRKDTKKGARTSKEPSPDSYDTVHAYLHALTVYYKSLHGQPPIS